MGKEKIKKEVSKRLKEKEEQTKSIAGVEVSKGQYRKVIIWMIVGLALGIGVWYVRVRMGWF